MWTVLAAASGSGLLVFLKVYWKRIVHFFSSKKNKCDCGCTKN